MKTKPKMVWLVCGLVALTAGCQQNELDFPGGKVLKAVIEGGQTKVSFDSYEGKFAWTPDDQLAVYYSDGTKSIATVATDGTVEVPASTASRYRSYYAVYPASVVENITDGSQPLVVTLPYSYDISDIVANASGNPGADFSPLPMVAQNDEDNDILMFYHVGGLLRITLTGVKVGTKQVLVMFDKGVTGSFAVSNPGTDHPTISAAEVEGYGFTNDYVLYTVDNTDEGITDSSKPIVLNVPVPCGTYNTVSVSTIGTYTGWKTQTYDGNPLTFKRHHGKRLSFGDLTVDFAFGTDNDSGYFVGLNDAEVEYTGGDGTLSANFVSYKTDGTTKEPVPFTLEYSEDGGTTWNTSAPSWLTPGTIDLGGSTTGQSVIYTAKPQVDTWENPHPGKLRAKGTRTDYDLSKYNVATGSPTDKSRTANCYVVDRPGSYKFPLVYGNGIDWEKNPDTGINEDAYHSRKGVNGAYRPDADTGIETNGTYVGMDVIYRSYYIGSFRDHLDQYIASPYIATQQSGKTLTATLVWEDVQGLVTDVDIQQGVSGEDTYLTFRVPSETIDQGNALVAVLADGKIAWSWHIWVTEENLTVDKAVPSGYPLAPVNLGWCDGKEEFYAPRTCKVRATQEGTGKTYTAIFKQTGYNPKFLGNNPFYQWGRKDPMQAWNGKDGIGDQEPKTYEPKTYYPVSEAYAPRSVFAKTTLGGSIQNPFVFYSAHGEPTDSWCSTDYINLWSNNFNGTDDIKTLATVSKTVYDPSPVGYHVPSVAAFDGFTTSNLLFRRENGIPGWFYNDSLLFPVTGHLRYIPSQSSYTGLFFYQFYSWTANSALHRGLGVYAGAWRGNYNSTVVTNSDSSKDEGQPVRPVKD